jgi:predicted GNAT superfamily acetyltransferase
VAAVRSGGGRCGRRSQRAHLHQPVRTGFDGAVRLVQVPSDIVAIRRTDPGGARAWRIALRDVLVASFADGFEVVGATRSSWYVLAPAGA